MTEENKDMPDEKITHTHIISAVTYKDNLCELTWEDIETGKHAHLEIALSPEKCKEIRDVVWPCVYYKAKTKSQSIPIDKLVGVVKDLMDSGDKYTEGANDTTLADTERAKFRECSYVAYAAMNSVQALISETVAGEENPDKQGEG